MTLCIASYGSHRRLVTERAAIVVRQLIIEDRISRLIRLLCQAPKTASAAQFLSSLGIDMAGIPLASKISRPGPISSANENQKLRINRRDPNHTKSPEATMGVTATRLTQGHLSQNDCSSLPHSFYDEIVFVRIEVF